MSLREDFRPVSRRVPCPICGRPDWCLVSIEGGSDPVSAVCPRIESPIRLGEAGWLHKLRDSEMPKPVRKIEIEFEPKDYRPVADRFARFADLEAIAAPLGLEARDLRRLGVGFDVDQSASTWPEVDSARRVVGILRRFPNGSKRLRLGDRCGLFVPRDLPLDLLGERLLVLEGGSDTAAALGLGRWAVGRHSKSSGFVYLARLARELRPSTVSIVAHRDKDGGGLAWARKLAERLDPFCADVRVVETPATVKDLRDWCRRGDAAVELSRAEEVSR